MAWTDQCKYAAIDRINKVKEDKGKLQPAFREVSKESDIPAKTLERWYYEKDSPKNEEVSQESPATTRRAVIPGEDRESPQESTAPVDTAPALMTGQEVPGSHYLETTEAHKPQEEPPPQHDSLQKLDRLVERLRGGFGTVESTAKKLRRFLSDNGIGVEDERFTLESKREFMDRELNALFAILYPDESGVVDI